MVVPMLGELAQKPSQESADSICDVTKVSLQLPFFPEKHDSALL
jgi:hypothetical protein